MEDKKSIEKLKLSNENLSAIPNKVFKLKKLKSLDVSYNQMKVGEEEDNSGQLQPYDSISSSIKELEFLEELYLNNNDIAEIPDYLGEMRSLKVLDFSSNSRIEKLPESFRQLVNLDKLNLEGTALSQIKGFDASKSPKEIIEFLLRNQDRKPVYLNEAKLLIVGDENAGKTSLVRRLVYNDFSEKYRSTPGIDIKPYKLSRYRLNIWDFAGQEITYQVHNLFMSKESLYILVLDGQKEDNQTETLDWLETISSNANNPSIIIVVNKSDFNLGYKIDEKLYRDKFKNIKDIVYTSAKENSGFKELKHSILLHIETLKGIREKFVKKYLKVKEHIENLAQKEGEEKYILEANEFDNICKEISREEKRDLRIILNEIGTIIGFQNDDMSVINPRWILKILYEIIRSKKITDKAEFDLDNLDEIMQNEEYSDRHYEWIIKFLIENKIALRLKDKKIMIPSRLPLNSPEEFIKEEYMKVHTKYGLNFRYRYLKRFKKSILFNFIIQMQEYIKKEEPKYWANGVFLEYKDVKAVVLSSKVDKTIDIHIPTNTKESKELFQKIKTTLDELSKGDWDIETDGDVFREIAIVHEGRIKRYKNYDFLRNKQLEDEKVKEVELDIWKKPINRNLSDLLDRYENKEDFIFIEKEKKRDNFKNGLKGFLIEYKSAINNPNDFKRHAENCGNHARKIGEAFCRYIILDSDKSDEDKIKAIKKLLFDLTKTISEEERPYIIDKHERDTIKERLNRLRNIGNSASHDNAIITNKFDLDEVKNNLLYFEDYLFNAES